MSQGEHRPKKRVEGVILEDKGALRLFCTQKNSGERWPFLYMSEEMRSVGFKDNDEFAIITLEELDSLVLDATRWKAIAICAQAYMNANANELAEAILPAEKQ